MAAYGSDDRTLHVVDEFDGGVGWQVYPDETLARTSHALQTADGLWLLDPLDTSGLEDLLAAYGDVAGVAVCSSWHARDADTIATRHDVPVSIPTWMERIPERVDAPIERFETALGDTDYQVRKTTPLPSWQEAILYHEREGTLYVPESMGSGGMFTVGDERLGVSIYRRLLPPRDVLSGVAPERVLCGHGTGVFEDATTALAEALSGARKRAPRAFVTHGLTAAKTMWESRNH